MHGEKKQNMGGKLLGEVTPLLIRNSIVRWSRRQSTISKRGYFPDSFIKQIERTV